MNDTTAIIISFLRPAYTIACIQSLKDTYPDIQIIVGENGNYQPKVGELCEKLGARYIQLPYDSGVCVGRNTLIKEVTTPYVLIGDDDFFYTKEAMVYQMRAFIGSHLEYDLIGGRVSVNGVTGNYQGFIEKGPRSFRTERIDPETHTFEKDEVSGLRYCKADLTYNYFLGRTEKIRAVPWDEEIKVAYEHFSWFYDFKVAGGNVAFSPDPVVIHKPGHVRGDVDNTQEHATYMAFRNRKSDKDRFFAKYQIDYTIGMNGVKTYAPDHIIERRKNDTKAVDFCITTFMRPNALKKLLISIAEFYPMANVYVADQNEVFDREFYKKLRAQLMEMGLAKRPSFEHLPYDCGLSYARNHLVMTTPNPLKLILDDDFEFTKETDIGKMVKLMEAHPKAGIVGGRVRQLGTDVHFEFNLEIQGDTIVQIPDKQPLRDFNGTKFKKTGCVLNFALMRKDLFRYIQWDQDLKVTEHTDFYLRMKNVPYQILYTPDVVVEHPPAMRESNYKEMRQRPEFLVHMLKKHKVTRLKYLNGQVMEAMPDESIKRYKTKI